MPLTNPFKISVNLAGTSLTWNSQKTTSPFLCSRKHRIYSRRSSLMLIIYPGKVTYSATLFVHLFISWSYLTIPGLDLQKDKREAFKAGDWMPWQTADIFSWEEVCEQQSDEELGTLVYYCQRWWGFLCKPDTTGHQDNVTDSPTSHHSFVIIPFPTDCLLIHSFIQY